MRVHPLLIGGSTAALVAAPGILDFDDVGPQPCERLSARGSGLELGQIKDLHIL